VCGGCARVPVVLSGSALLLAVLRLGYWASDLNVWPIDVDGDSAGFLSCVFGGVSHGALVAPLANAEKAQAKGFSGYLTHYFLSLLGKPLMNLVPKIRSNQKPYPCNFCR
jgi:hypothetical protein